MPTPPWQHPSTVVRTSERLWSDVVAEAQGCDPIKPAEPAYQWSNGRVHAQPRDPYAPNPEPTP